MRRSALQMMALRRCSETRRLHPVPRRLTSGATTSESDSAARQHAHPAHEELDCHAAKFERRAHIEGSEDRAAAAGEATAR